MGNWKVVGSLIQGLYADPSIFRWGGAWWMFACDTPFEHRSLRLFYARHLEGPWVEHHGSPIVQDNASIARPTGRVLALDGRLIRFERLLDAIRCTGVERAERPKMSADLVYGKRDVIQNYP